MTLTIAPAALPAVFDVNALRLTVNRVNRKYLAGKTTDHATDAFRESLRRLSKLLTDGRGVRALTDTHYGPAAHAAMVDLSARLAWLESGVKIERGGLRSLTAIVDRAATAVIAGSVDHGPALAPHDAPMATRLPLLAARVAWLDDRINDAIDEEEESVAAYFTRERDSLMWEISGYGSETLRANGYRTDGQRTAANRIPGLDA